MLKPDLNEKFVPEIQSLEITGLAKSDRQMVANVKIDVKVKKNGISSIRVGISNFYDPSNSTCSAGGGTFDFDGGYENGYLKSLVPIKTVALDSTYSINTYVFASKIVLNSSRFSFCESNKYFFDFVSVVSTSNQSISYSKTYDKNGDFYPLLFLSSTWLMWNSDKSINPPCAEFKVRTDSYGIAWRVACDLTFDLSPSNAKIRIASNGLVPKLGIAKKTSSSFEIPILNYSSDFNWKIESSRGLARIQDGKIIISGLQPYESSILEVSTSREGYTDEIIKIIDYAESPGYKDPETLKVEADAKAAADLKAKQEADAKAAAEIAKKEADAKAAAEIAKKEADAKAAAEIAAGEKIIADAKAEAARILAAAKAAAAKKKVTITCIKGKSVKKVTAVKPVCPKGYKKK